MVNTLCEIGRLVRYKDVFRSGSLLTKCKAEFRGGVGFSSSSLNPCLQFPVID